MMAEILVECATEKKLITFSDLANRVGIGRRQVGLIAGIISQKCRDLDLPLISVLIVYKSTNRTGDGFIKIFFPKEYENGTGNKIVEEEMKKVYAQQDWNKLLNSY